eukprot:gnl/TRDRNA2_/TRDRNA2_85170_c0_seq1.p1 gnl/TRDRNA2_/TRDRNA2_85170_c0~~gnl/TRDRNA2_/TRDRNA2_85170_c0_seq1.p1  ORF type:complete len:445 (+),score=63.43 gnl/TRDRNA2_/TRDRNA2_85170_c0_seq1:73-1407(+)
MVGAVPCQAIAAPLAVGVAAAGTAADRSWRSRLVAGDAVGVRSAGAGGWLRGKVTAANDQKVKVAYLVGDELCDKVVLRISPDIRQLVMGSPAPQAPPPPNRSPPRARATDTTPRGLRSPQEYAAIQGSPSPYGQRRWVEPPPAPSPGVPGNVSAPRLTFSAGEWLRLADLQFGEMLGSGGFGCVFRGWLRGEEVAIKRLHIEHNQASPEQLAEFQKEVGNLQALRHPRLIRFIGVALESPVLCMVTELAAGGSLYALLHVQKARLPEARRHTLTVQITEGVDFLHGRQPPCVHRDLKSANVVLDSELNAKLCDFGLMESMEKTHLSRREAEGGSPRYMAPEVFDARSKLTEKIDVWALGCLVIEIFSDRLPHEDCSTIQQVAAKLLVRQGTPYEDDWADGTQLQAVHSLISPCFVHDPTGRPSASEVLEGLRLLRLSGLAVVT